jgi:hypothetical protein
MEDQLAVVFRGGPFAGRVDTLPTSGQPRYFDTRDGGWALYSLTKDYVGERRVLQYQHGSDDAVPAVAVIPADQRLTSV